MPLLSHYDATATAPKAEPLKPGTYVGVCYAIANIGKQLNKKFGKYTEKVVFLFELDGTQIEFNGEVKRYVFSKDYSNTLSPDSNLRKLLKDWNHEDPLTGKFTTTIREITDPKTGKTIREELRTPATSYDLENQLGKTAMITLDVYKKLDGTTGNCISSIIGAPDAVKITPENDLISFDIYEYREIKAKYEAGDQTAKEKLDDLISKMDALPKWLIDKAMTSGEPEEAAANNANGGQVLDFENFQNTPIAVDFETAKNKLPF